MRTSCKGKKKFFFSSFNFELLKKSLADKNIFKILNLKLQDVKIFNSIYGKMLKSSQPDEDSNDLVP